MKIVVKEKGLLLDYLLNNLDMSSKSIKKYLKNKMIYVDGVNTSKFDYPVNKNSVIMIDSSKKQNILPFPILYEDNYIIVINKPSGLLSISTSKEKEKTAYHLVGEYLRNKNKNSKVFVVHRLDKDTSGVLLLAKDEHTKNILQKDWNNFVKKRSYIAVVHGIMENKEERLVNYLQETKTNLVYITNKDKGKIAITNYKLIKQKNNYSKLQINIETGRKNQIRVQLANINHPIVGDKKYGSDSEKRLFLHADRLDIYNPILKKEMSFCCKTPEIFNSIL